MSVRENWCSRNSVVFRTIYKYATAGAQWVFCSTPFLPLFHPVWAGATDARTLFLTSLYLNFFHCSFPGTHPFVTLRWWANWCRSESTSARPAPCGTTWWRRTMFRPTWSASPTSSTTSSSRRSRTCGSCRKCWLVFSFWRFLHAEYKVEGFKCNLYATLCDLNGNFHFCGVTLDCVL